MSNSKTKIAYLVPEFPGQTHAFFWREIKCLENINRPAFTANVEIFSTRPPVMQIKSHTWTAEAETRTSYLFPSNVKSIIRVLLGLWHFLMAGLSVWKRCIRVIRESEMHDVKAQLRLFALVLFGASLSERCLALGCQHIHSHSCADSAHIALFAHLISGIPYSVTLHGPLRDYGSNQRQKWRYAAFGIVITKTLWEEIKTELAGDLPSIVKLAPMGVDIDSMKRDAPYQTWNEGESLRLFSCGRLNPCKGHGDLIKAVAHLKAQGHSVRLEIAGEDEMGGLGYHLELCALIKKLDVSEEVLLLGAVAESRIREGLEKCHCFVLASRQEPLGVVIMEAMAMEVPVISTRAGGVTELVEDSYDGILLDSGAPEQIADAILNLRSKPQKAQKLGQRGREKVSTCFHSGISAEVLLKTIQEATSSKLV